MNLYDKVKHLNNKSGNYLVRVYVTNRLDMSSYLDCTANLLVSGRNKKDARTKLNHALKADKINCKIGRAWKQ